jgi:hypothetical protein
MDNELMPDLYSKDISTLNCHPTNNEVSIKLEEGTTTRTLEEWLVIISEEFPNVAVTKLFKENVKCQKTVILQYLEKLKKLPAPVHRSASPRKAKPEDLERKPKEVIPEPEPEPERKRDGKDIRTMFKTSAEKKNIKKQTSKKAEPTETESDTFDTEISSDSKRKPDTNSRIKVSTSGLFSKATSKKRKSIVSFEPKQEELVLLVNGVESQEPDIISVPPMPESKDIKQFFSAAKKTPKTNNLPEDTPKKNPNDDSIIVLSPPSFGTDAKEELDMKIEKKDDTNKQKNIFSFFPSKELAKKKARIKDSNTEIIANGNKTPTKYAEKSVDINDTGIKLDEKPAIIKTIESSSIVKEEEKESVHVEKFKIEQDNEEDERDLSRKRKASSSIRGNNKRSKTCKDTNADNSSRRRSTRTKERVSYAEDVDMMVVGEARLKVEDDSLETSSSDKENVDVGSNLNTCNLGGKISSDVKGVLSNGLLTDTSGTADHSSDNNIISASASKETKTRSTNGENPKLQVGPTEKATGHGAEQIENSPANETDGRRRSSRTRKPVCYNVDKLFEENGKKHAKKTVDDIKKDLDESVVEILDVGTADVVTVLDDTIDVDGLKEVPDVQLSDGFQVPISPSKKATRPKIDYNEDVSNSYITWLDKYQPMKARYLAGDQASNVRIANILIVIYLRSCCFFRW